MDAEGEVIIDPGQPAGHRRSDTTSSSGIKIPCIGFAIAVFSMVSSAQAEGLKGQFLVTGNVSTIGESLASFNQRLGVNYAPTWTPGNFDYRYERYTEPSFHGQNDGQVNERTLESQLMYSHPLNKQFSVTVGGLYHTNRTFRDNYYWAVSGVTCSGDITSKITASAAALIERRTTGGRAFYDLSGGIEYKPVAAVGVFANAHLYENLGESDLRPTRKREYEVGVNYYISQRYYAGISHFRHWQVDDTNDRFAVAKVKFGVNF